MTPSGGPARTLAERLHDLAEDAPHDLGAGGRSTYERDLWTRGRRRQRRHQVGVAALTMVVLLLVGSLATLVVDQTRGRVLPADTEQVLGLPDRLHTPSPWLDDTSTTGPLGRLVAVVGAERRTVFQGASHGLVGVSATGEYAFLDLPDRAATDDFDLKLVLSADGRFVAYPTTDGQPVVSPTPGVEAQRVTGVAVYDSTTGEVQRRELPSEKGRTVDGLAWVGHSLYVDFFAVESRDADGLSARQVDPFRWDLTTGSVADVDGDLVSRVSRGTPAGDRVVLLRGRQVVTVDPLGRERPVVELDRGLRGRAALSPDGSRVAVKDDDGGGASRQVWWAEVAGPDAGRTRAVPGEPGDELVGWRDESHVALRSYQEYVAVDLLAGDPERVLVLPEVRVDPGTVVAADALRGPGFSAAEPDRPVSPLLLLWLGVGVAATLVAALVLWRLRRLRRLRGSEGCGGRRMPGAEREDADLAEFEEFVRARRGALLRTAYLLTGQHADAEDLVQRALVKAVPHWRRIRDQPEPYVRRIMSRESISRWRRRRWREISTGELPEPRPGRAPAHDPGREGWAERWAERDEVRRALATLSPRQRAVLVLRYFEDLTERETAEALDLAVGTVKSHARDGLAALRRTLALADEETLLQR